MYTFLKFSTYIVLEKVSLQKRTPARVFQERFGGWICLFSRVYLHNHHLWTMRGFVLLDARDVHAPCKL